MLPVECIISTDRFMSYWPCQQNLIIVDKTIVLKYWGIKAGSVA